FCVWLGIHCRAVVQGGAAGRRARRGAPAPLVLLFRRSLQTAAGARKMPRPLASDRGIGHRNTEKGDEIAEGATQTTSIPLFTTRCESSCNDRRPPKSGPQDRHVVKSAPVFMQCCRVSSRGNRREIRDYCRTA